jgi:hypothetical protein
VLVLVATHINHCVQNVTHPKFALNLDLYFESGGTGRTWTWIWTSRPNSELDLDLDFDFEVQLGIGLGLLGPKTGLW